jgi:hypothetical protein
MTRAEVHGDLPRPSVIVKHGLIPEKAASSAP